MSGTSFFILRSHERGYDKIMSQMLPSGAHAVPVHSTYLAGHPDASLIRHSSFNFHEYQNGIDGFGKIKVFGDEIFSPNGCGYNMHPHHNFIIMAFILQGTLTHINTAGKEGVVDMLKPGDYYIFSTGAGGKHSELNISPDESLHVIYVWLMPDKLYGTPSYLRSHFDPKTQPNKIVPLISNETSDALPVEQDFKVSRLASDNNKSYVYKPASKFHGMYFFVIEGALEIEKNNLEKRDSIGMHGFEEVNFHVKADKTDILILETIM